MNIELIVLYQKTIIFLLKDYKNQHFYLIQKIYKIELELKYSLQTREIFFILTWSSFFYCLETSVKISNIIET